MKKYASEESRVWEDLRHGLILGSLRFVESIKERYLPEVPHREIPQQRQAARLAFSETDLRHASQRLGYDLEKFRKAARVSADAATKRDLLIFLARQSGGLTNQEIGEMLGLSYSAVSRRVSLFKEKLAADKALAREYNRIRAMMRKRS